MYSNKMMHLDLAGVTLPPPSDGITSSMNRLFSNVSIIGSQFDYKLEIFDGIEGIKWTSDLQEGSVKADLMSYAINTNNELTFGYHITQGAVLRLG